MDIVQQKVDQMRSEGLKDQEIEKRLKESGIEWKSEQTKIKLPPSRIERPKAEKDIEGVIYDKICAKIDEIDRLCRDWIEIKKGIGKQYSRQAGVVNRDLPVIKKRLK